MTDATRHLLLSWALPAIALVIATCAAFYQLSESPAVWYDEGFFAQAAINLNTHGLQVMQLSPGTHLSSWSISAGYPLIYPISVAFDWFGVSVFSARSVTALYTVLFVAVVYLFIRREAGVVFAGIAALLLASLPLLYGNGKAVLGEVPALFYFILMLLALQRFERSGYTNRFAAFMVGITAGLSFAAKFTFMIMPLVLILAYVLRSRGKGRIERDTLLVLFGGFILPVAVWLSLQFQSGDSISLVLGFFANAYNYDAVSRIWLILTNGLRFITEVTPFYLLVMFLSWVMAIFIRVRSKIPVSLPEVVAFLFTVGIILEYLVSPGWYRYFFPALCVSLIYFPSASITVWEWIRSTVRFSVLRSWIPYAVFILLITVQFYQLGWNSYVATYYGSTRTAELTTYFSGQDPQESVLLYNVPEIALFLSNQDLYQYLAPHTNQSFGEENFARIQNRMIDRVVVNAETYQRNPDRFGSYRIADTVSRYVILTRP